MTDPTIDAWLDAAPSVDSATAPTTDDAATPNTDSVAASTTESAVVPPVDLTEENQIAQTLRNQFSGIDVSVQRPRRVWASVTATAFRPVLEFLHNELGFISLAAVTGLDSGENYELIYHLTANRGLVLSLKESAPKTAPFFETATDIYLGGILYELEARNLLGIVIRGIPEDINYPLPDDWPAGEYPLRKEWTGLESEAALSAGAVDAASAASAPSAASAAAGNPAIVNQSAANTVTLLARDTKVAAAAIQADLAAGQALEEMHHE
ncbi:MAG: NADH-quinone oxidoreductase subunit C [Actinomycetia bacterium]|nr:NADH-quinone oxidoreductase subunit C [Actinomycetes bacterium]